MTRPRPSVAIFVTCGLWLVALGLYFAGRKGTGVVLAVAGLATVATMSWTNFVIESEFKWLLLAPAVLWCAGIAAYAVEGRE